MVQSCKELLASRGYVIGSRINTTSPIVAEIMAAAEFDFLVVDCEHSSIDLQGTQRLFQAIAAAGTACVPMVRMPGNTYESTKRYLDAGAGGVIAPLINSGAQARELVRSAKYPPLGDRGVGYGRSHGYGFAFDEYMARANEMVFTCVQIEHVEAVRNLDAILSVEGIDAAFIGPYDLTASMGITARFDHPEYIAARTRILRACEEHGVAAGVHVVQPRPEEVNARLDEGFSVIAYSLDITMLGTACRQGLRHIHDARPRN
jgi:2-dehydro-3-deoxyglucarate aldolase